MHMVKTMNCSTFKSASESFLFDINEAQRMGWWPHGDKCRPELCLLSCFRFSILRNQPMPRPQKGQHSNLNLQHFFSFLSTLPKFYVHSSNTYFPIHCRTVVHLLLAQSSRCSAV